MDRKAIQALLSTVQGKPESFAINLAVLKSLTRAEYSPEKIGHFALASLHYCHFTSPIRRYADLTIHRLLDAYFSARTESGSVAQSTRKKVVLEDVPTYDDLVKVGQHISFTERRSQDAERELRQVKVLELLEKHIGEEFDGVITGITNFGIFVQIRQYLIDGLIRYEDLMDDWWQVDEKAGKVFGQRTGTRIGIGDVAKVVIVGVDLARRELNLAVRELGGKRNTTGVGGNAGGGGGGRGRGRSGGGGSGRTGGGGGRGGRPGAGPAAKNPPLKAKAAGGRPPQGGGGGGGKRKPGGKPGGRKRR
jgi:ribonuclease R